MYLVSVDIVIKSVTCPGVWLCPKGSVVLKIRAFGESKKSKQICPKFPLLFRETLNFQKIEEGNMMKIIDLLKEQPLKIELIQWLNVHSNIGVLLAKFHQSLDAMLDLTFTDDGLKLHTNVEILMRRTDNFPGIISPKIMACIRLSAEELSNYQLENGSLKKKVPVFYSEIDDDALLVENIIRQRPVCHVNNKRCDICGICSEFSNCCKHHEKKYRKR